MRTLPGPPAHQWDRLAATASNIFGTRAWCECWWQHYGADGSPLLVAGGDGAGAFLAPLYTTGGALRRVRFIGNGPADQLGPLCAPTARQDAASAVRSTLTESRLRWDVFLAHDLAEHEGWDRILGATVIRRTASPVIRLGTRVWDEFLASRSKNFREQVRRRERKLRKAFAVDLRLATSTSLGDDLTTLFRLHAARWGARAPFATGVERHFHEDFARRALSDGRLRLWVLELNGKPAAALYGFRFAGAEYYHQSGRDPAFDEYSLGSVLLAHSVRDAVQDGVGEYRLLRGGEGYKSRFADAERGVHTLAVAKGLKGRAAIRAALLRRTA